MNLGYGVCARCVATRKTATLDVHFSPQEQRRGCFYTELIAP